jgi:hypothetical protein
MHSDHSGPEIRKEQLSRLKQVRNHHHFITIIQQFRGKKLQPETKLHWTLLGDSDN